MRQGKVFYQNHFAGVVTETNDGDYTFEYDNDYIQKFPYQFITFSMPVSEKLYRENRLFPFFFFFFLESWQLEIAFESWKIDMSDSLGCLLACCKNCIGAVSVEPIIVKSDG